MDRYDLDLTQAARRAYVVTPDNDNDLPIATRGIYIGTAGTLKVLHVGDTSPVTYPVTIAGCIYPLAVKRIYATGTGASDIIAQV